MAYSPHKLREILTAQGRRHDWLAAQTEYTPETIARYLNGHQPISNEFAQRAARVLGIPVEWLRADEPAEASVA